MIVRESKLGQGMVFGVTLWALWFSFDVARIGSIVTSKQWQYLMEIPGGKYFWATVFGSGALLAGLGMLWHRYTISAAGLFIVGSACLLIAAFYLLAPLVDDGLLTLGYNPWLVPALFAYFCAVLTGWTIRWF